MDGMTTTGPIPTCPQCFGTSWSSFSVDFASQAEIARLRRGLLDVMTESGADTSGIDHPDQLVYPDIVEAALAEVRRLRLDYEACLREIGL